MTNLNLDIYHMTDEFCDLLREVHREGFDAEKIIEALKKTDFFEAPASTVYHTSCRGGLLDHSLNVFYNLSELVNMKGLQDLIPAESVIIVGLLHDISKANFYTEYTYNKKVYDDKGKFEWKEFKEYKVRDNKDRFILGSHSENAAYILSQFCKLTQEEYCAVMNHMGGHDSTTPNQEMSAIFNRYPLAILLHCADEMATFVDERLYNE